MQHFNVISIAFAIAAAGCGDSNNTPAGPIKLVRIMVQDVKSPGGRGVVMDLLDTPGSTYSTAVACDDGHPCRVVFLLGQFEPDFSCTAAGTCNDPLAAGLAPLTPPALGGTQVRLVFNKLLSSMITPSSAVEVDDASGTKIDGTVSLDPAGTADTSSDPLRLPMGPALVFKPTVPFAAAMQYTIRVNAAAVTASDGSPLADASGSVVSGTYTKSFTTENLVLVPQSTLSNVTAATGVTIRPDEILQLGFNAPAASATACTATSGGAPVLVTAYADAGSDVANCAAADATLLNIVAVDGSGAPVDWAAGDYTLSCSVAAAGGGGTITVAGSFTVGGSAVPSDPQSRTQHVICP